jgi:hypothetical protein
MNVNVNNTSFNLGLKNNNNRCNLCPQNNTTTKSINAPKNENKQMNAHNYFNNKNKILICPSLPPK